MSRLIRMDTTGHTTLAEWTLSEPEEIERAVVAFREELARGYIAVVSHQDGTAEVVRELPAEAPLVIMRRAIAGG
jgi:hypothetical protein